MHPLRQSSFLRIKRLGTADVLTACPTCLPCRCAAFPAEFKFKLSQAGQNAGHHSPRRVRGIDALTQRAEDDIAFSEFANRHHHLGGVVAKTVNTNHHDGIAGTMSDDDILTWTREREGGYVSAGGRREHTLDRVSERSWLLTNHEDDDPMLWANLDHGMRYAENWERDQRR